MLFRIIIFGCVRLIPWRVLLPLSKYKEYDGSTLVAGTELLIIYSRAQELFLVNDRNDLKRDSAETEASATFTEASAEASAESFPRKWVKIRQKLGIFR